MTCNQFIDMCRVREIPNGTYTEKHHIVPRCMGGTNEPENLIMLTAQEHYEAHKLLAKENPDNDKLQYAWLNMCHRHNHGQMTNIFVTAIEYAQARKLRAKLTSKQFKGKKQSEEHVKKRTQKQLGRHASEETRMKMHNLMLGKFAGEKNPMYHRPLTGPSKENMIKHQPNSKRVKCCDTGIIYDSISAASKATGCGRKEIDYCCQGKYKQTKGYHWQYA